ncbi:MAG: hypothetical protein KAH38_04315, partial [Candidatus Hydrogenedentes bacterium]|nr:hypothetical protein [Candidatus Hydrogenedentota bacterium]
MRTLFLCSLLCFSFTSISAAPPPAAALFGDTATGVNPELAAALEKELVSTGYTVTTIDSTILSNPKGLDAAEFSLLVLPDARRLPMHSIKAVHGFLKQGGNLLALNTPAWREQLIFVNNEWQTAEMFRKKSVLDPPPNIILDFTTESLDHWQRSAMYMDMPTQYTLIPDAVHPG